MIQPSIKSYNRNVPKYIPIPVKNLGIGKYDKDGALIPQGRKSKTNRALNTYGENNHNVGLILECVEPNGKITKVKIHNTFAANWVLQKDAII